jgi:hypothetical protein
MRSVRVPSDPKARLCPQQIAAELQTNSALPRSEAQLWGLEQIVRQRLRSAFEVKGQDVKPTSYRFLHK